MSAQFPRRRRITIAALLVLVAVIAIGLEGTIRFSGWWKLRKVHPDLAPVTALVDGSTRTESCAQCHAATEKPPVLIARKSFSIPLSSVHPPTLKTTADCKKCHAL